MVGRAIVRCIGNMQTFKDFVVKAAPRILAITLLGISLGACGDARKAEAGPTAGAEESKPTKMEANTSYRTPSLKGPVPRNPDLRLPSNFTKSAGVTFTRVPINEPYIAMTFDDGPHSSNTPRLLDMLRQRNIKATFYVVGRNVDMYPAITRRIVAEGHEIGNHTWSHPNLTKLSNEGVRNELLKTKAAIGRAAGVQPRTMRPPYGALRQDQRAWILEEFGYPTILWSVDPLDWKKPGPSVVTSRILGATSNGGIVLAHDLHSQTVDAMPATLDGLLRKGFKFVTVSQLLAMQPTTEVTQSAAR